MHNAVRSKAFMINQITDLEKVCNEDWDKLLLDDMSNECYASFPTQMQYLNQLHFLKVKVICNLLQTSTKTYYNV